MRRDLAMMFRVAALLMVTCWSSPLAAQETIRISADPSCPECRITVTEIARLEADPMTAPCVSTEAAGLARDSSGRIYVASCRTQEVEIFSAEGTFIQEFGGQGEGPGEFPGYLTLIKIRDDVLYVFAGSRVSLFAVPDMSLISDHSIPRRGRLYDVLHLGEYIVEVRDFSGETALCPA